jgi:hypothetical protein
MSDTTRKVIGNNNKAAREAAIKTLMEFKGCTVTGLGEKNQDRLLVAVMQWLGLADEKGKIK